MSDQQRFIVIEGSHSSHCCFQYSVIDTSEGKTEHSGSWEYCICETNSKEDADLICEALNDNIDPIPIVDVTENIQQTKAVIEANKIINDNPDKDEL